MGAKPTKQTVDPVVEEVFGKSLVECLRLILGDDRLLIADFTSFLNTKNMWAHAAVCIYYCANIKFTFRSRASWGCDFAREAWFHAFLLTTSQLHRCSDPEGSKKIGQGAYPLALCHIFYRHKPFLKAFVHSRYLPRSMETLQTVSNQAKRFVSICVSTHYYFFRSWNSVRSLATPVISCPNIVI